MEKLYFCDFCHLIYKPIARYDCLGHLHIICGKCYCILVTKNLFLDAIDKVCLETDRDYIDSLIFRTPVG
jgi:hypothetical protein